MHLSAVHVRWSAHSICLDQNKLNWKRILWIRMSLSKSSVCQETVTKCELKLSIIIVRRSRGKTMSRSVWMNFSPFLGENPQFNETFEFEIAFSELTMIRFVVLDDDSLDYDFIGQFTLPFDCIQPGQRIAWRTSPSVKSSYLGYRHVHLYTIGGDLIANAYLFVHIVVNSKSMAVVCSLSRIFSFLTYLLRPETAPVIIALSSLISTS